MIINLFQNNKKNKNVLYLTNNPCVTFEQEIVFIKNNNDDLVFNNQEKIQGLYKVNEVDFAKSNNKKEIVNDFKKFFITSFHISFFHFFMQTLSTIIEIIQNFEKPFFIIDCISIVPENKGWLLKNYNRVNKDKIFYINLIINYLEKHNIKYLLLNEEYVIKVNNCYFITDLEKSNTSFNEINNIINSYVLEKNIIPYRKVYISKRITDINSTHKNQSLTSITEKNAIELRIINENMLALFLKEHGFEIINSETDFNSMEEQINYFNTVKTICSVTQAGLVNTLLMQPNSNVIEFISPMFENNPNLTNPYRLHSNEYVNICYSQNHNYIGIKNMLDANLIIEKIKSNKMLLDIIKS